MFCMDPLQAFNKTAQCGVFLDKVSNTCWLYATFNACNAVISHWLFSFCLRNNTKPKQESFEFKAPQGPPPQPPTQVSPQVRKDGPVMHSPVASFIHTSISCLHQIPQQSTRHPINFLPTSTFVFSSIHPAVLAPKHPFFLCPFMHQPFHPPTFPRTSRVHFYLFFFPLYVHLLALSEPMH